jgi:hypothetical protein
MATDITNKLACMWCCGHYPNIVGPTHDYIESTPGCWAAYGRVLALHYQNYPAFEHIHRLAVDTYAIQHPGKPSRRAIQSVWGHVLASFWFLRQQLPSDEVRTRLGTFVDGDHSGRNGWLTPPEFSGALNVSHINVTADIHSHVASVHDWGESVFDRWWSMHGDLIERVAHSLEG